MKLPKPIVDFVLRSENAQSEVTEAVKAKVEEKEKEWFVGAATELTKRLQPRKYVTTRTQQDITAKVEDSDKDMNTLWGLYSNAPGSIQCANRIKE